MTEKKCYVSEMQRCRRQFIAKMKQKMKEKIARGLESRWRSKIQGY